MVSFGSGVADGPERLDASAFPGGKLSRPGTWAVAFVADWCPFCRRFAPEFAGLATPGAHLAFGDVTSDSSPLWDRFQIEIIPTVIVFRNGEVVRRFDGRPAEGLGRSDLDELRGVLGGV